MRISKVGMMASGLGVSLVLMAGALSLATFADNTDVIDKVILQAPTACTMSGTGTTFRNAEISNGQSNSSVGDNLALADISGIVNWDSSNVTSLQATFGNSIIQLTNLDALSSWDVSSATNMSGMFSDSVSLTDASAIDGWDVRGVTPDTSGGTTDIGFNKMFNNTSVRPTFTLRPGTWTENGTFVLLS